MLGRSWNTMLREPRNCPQPSRVVNNGKYEYLLTFVPSYGYEPNLICPGARAHYAGRRSKFSMAQAAFKAELA